MKNWSPIKRALCVLGVGLFGLTSHALAQPSNAGTVGVIATDDDSNTGYTGSWGTPVSDSTHYGFGNWTNDGNGGSGGFFNGTSNGNDNGTGGLSNIDSSNGKSWGMFTGGGGIVDAFRSFTDVTSAQATASTLQIGQTLRFDMDNGNIATSNSVGFSLRNVSGQNVFEFFFTGGASDYSYNDATGVHTTTIPFTRAGLRTEFTMTSATTYTFSIYAGGSSTTPLQTITGGTIPISGTSPGTVSQIRPFSNSGQSGSAADAFFNTDQILLPTWKGGGTDTNWGTAGNWSGAGIQGVPINGNSIAFNGSPATLTSNNNSFLTSVNNISFNGTATPIANGPTTTNAGGYTLTGSALTISGGVDNNGTNTQTINIPLTLGAAQNFNATNGNLAFGGSTLTNGGFRLTVAGANNTSISNAISGAGDLLKQGAGTLTLSGNSTGWAANNTGTNGTNTNTNIFIDQGTVAAAANNAFGATDGATTGKIALGSSATANLTSAIMINTAGVTVANPIDARYFNTIGGSGTTGAETVGGTNTTGTATYSGTLTLHNNLALVAATGGTVNFSGAIAPGTAGSPYANEAVNGTPGLTIGGGGNNGTIQLSGTAANTYTGLTTINSGELDLNKTAGVNAIAGDGNTATNDVTVSGGTLKWLANEQVDNAATITISSGTVDLNGHTETLGTLINNGGVFTTDASGTGGHLIGTTASVQFNGGTSTITSGGIVEDGHIVVTGGTNTVQGGATEGLLHLLSGGLGLQMTGGNITLNSDAANPGRLLIEGAVSTNASATTSSITSGGSAANAGAVDLGTGTRTFTVATGTTPSGIDLSVGASIISPGGALTKAGTGTMELTGANTYAGGTIVSGGTLLANNTSGSATGSGGVMVNANGTLGGTGSIVATGNNININGNGTITGGKIGTVGALTLTASNVIFGGSSGNLSTYAVDISGSTSDRLNITGVLNLSSAFDQITFNGATNGSNYILATYTSETGTFASMPSLPVGYQLVYGATELDLVAVPEPGTWTAGTLAVVVLLGRIRSRRKKA